MASSYSVKLHSPHMLSRKQGTDFSGTNQHMVLIHGQEILWLSNQSSIKEIEFSTLT